MSIVSFDHWVTGYFDIILTALPKNYVWNISVILSHCSIHIGFEKLAFSHCKEASWKGKLPCLFMTFLLLLWFICSLVGEMRLWSWGELCSVTLLLLPLRPSLSPKEIQRLPSFAEYIEICCWQSLHYGWLFYLISITPFFSPHLWFIPLFAQTQNFCVVPTIHSRLLN